METYTKINKDEVKIERVVPFAEIEVEKKQVENALIDNEMMYLSRKQELEEKLAILNEVLK